MIKYLAGEIFKYHKTKILLYMTIILMLFSGLIQVIYYKTGTTVGEFSKAYSEEYYYIYMILSIYFSSNIIYMETENKIIRYINAKKLIKTKVILSVIFYILIILLSLSISSIISIVIYKSILLNYYLILKKIAKYSIELIFYNFLTMALALFIKNSALSLGITYMYILLSDKINLYVLSKKIKILYALPSLSLKNNLVLNSKLNIIISCIYIFFIYILLIKKAKNLNKKP